MIGTPKLANIKFFINNLESFPDMLLINVRHNSH